MRHCQASAVSWIVLSNLLRATSAECYYPAGNASTDWNYQPCASRNTTFSTCCVFDEGDTCLPNGLCNYPLNYIYRGACENQNGSNCPTICPGIKDGSFVVLKLCAEGEWCCAENRDTPCCDNNSQRFSLEERPPVSSTSSESATSTSQTRSSTSSTLVATTSSPSATAAAATEDPQSADDGRNEDTQGGSSPTAAIAGGVVGGVVGVAVVALAFWFWQRRRNAAHVATPVAVSSGAKSQAERYEDTACSGSPSSNERVQGSVQPLVEMSGYDDIQELDSGSHERHEMPGKG